VKGFLSLNSATISSFEIGFCEINHMTWPVQIQAVSMKLKADFVFTQTVAKKQRPEMWSLGVGSGARG